MAAPFKIFGSNALRTVLLSCIPAFEKTNNVTAAVEFGSTNHTLANMRAGATADLIIATSGALDELTRESKIMAGSRTELATSGVGACVRAGAAKPDISTVQALKQTLLNAKSLAHSKVGQSGIHFAKVIEQLRLADTIRHKVTINASGLVAELVARGEVELGFQQISELLAVKGIDLVGPLPDALQLNTRVAAGIGATTQQEAAARALIAALRSPEAAKVMRENGMTPVVG
ncbi:MAG: ABC transporter substrate-binding protein [Betaproteobacteria bacterium]|nr:ABC transporter substrate-binding protein [Betaproteobacteria bacterium]